MVTRTAVALIVAILTVGIVAGTVYVLARPAPQVSPSQSGSRTVGASCSITGAPVGGELHVLSDSGTPIAGARVEGSSTAYCNGQPQVITLPTVATNSSGWADLEPVYAAYNLTVTYSGHSYSISLPNQPMSATYATFLIPSGKLTTSFCFGGYHCGTQTSSESAYSVNATLVSRFCSNSSAIAKSGSQAADLQPSGSLGPIGFSIVSSGWKNVGSSPLSIGATCIDAVGTVPASGAKVGPTATTIQLSVSPSGPIQPGQPANISATFTGGSGIYYMPQGGLGITVIAAGGSSASVRGPVGGGFLTTASSPVPIASIRSASLIGGSTPALSALLAFNSSSPVSEVDVYLNGTYAGAVGVGHNTTSPRAPGQYDVSYNLRIAEQGRISIVSGTRYTIMFVAATGSFTETSVSIAVVAG